MKKFWEWLGKKYTFLYFYTDEKTWLAFNSKQMLIGYMIEYLSKKGKFIGMAPTSNKGFETIYLYYEHLKYEIKILYN